MSQMNFWFMLPINLNVDLFYKWNVDLWIHVANTMLIHITNIMLKYNLCDEWSDDFCLKWCFNVTNGMFINFAYEMLIHKRGECSGSLVECLTQDWSVAGKNLTDGTAFCPSARHIILAHLKTSCSIGKTPCGISLSYPRDLLIPSTWPAYPIHVTSNYNNLGCFQSDSCLNIM